MTIHFNALTVDEIVAVEAFRVLATMNPGGDYGKKELSPALRNRFTEVWVPPISSRADLLRIVADRCANDALRFVWLAQSDSGRETNSAYEAFQETIFATIFVLSKIDQNKSWSGFQ